MSAINNSLSWHVQCLWAPMAPTQRQHTTTSEPSLLSYIPKTAHYQRTINAFIYTKDSTLPANHQCFHIFQRQHTTSEPSLLSYIPKTAHYQRTITAFIYIYISTYYYRRPSMYTFIELFTTNNIITLKKLWTLNAVVNNQLIS